jgi:hypothetical protein
MRIAIAAAVLACARLAAAHPCDCDDGCYGPPAPPPEGLGLTLGAFTTTRPAHTGANDMFQTDYAFDSAAVKGAAFTIQYQPRDLVVAWDLAFGGGPITGTAMYTGDSFGSAPNGPLAFTGSEYETRTALRIGSRFALDQLALSAGTGIGGDLVISDAHLDHNFTLAMAPSGPDVDWYVPVWAAVTLTPSCNWGAQLYAAYDYHPSSPSESAPSFGAALLYQPAACSVR